MRKTVTQLENISASDLTRTILDGVEQKINALEQRLNSKEPPEFLDRKQVAKLLGISLVTVHDWSKKGVLLPFKIGHKIRYKREDIIATLERSRQS